MTKTVLVPIAEGSEEMEAVTIIDVLRRAGAIVTVASVGNLKITCSRGVKIEADTLIDQCASQTFDLIALPGGIPGAENLRDSQLLIQKLRQQKEEGRFFAAICASPAVVFQHHGLIDHLNATCHPAFKDQLPPKTEVSSRVVVDGGCITSCGPGTALSFSLKLVECLFGTEKMKEVAAPMVIDTL